MTDSLCSCVFWSRACVQHVDKFERLGMEGTTCELTCQWHPWTQVGHTLFIRIFMFWSWSCFFVEWGMTYCAHACPGLVHVCKMRTHLGGPAWRGRHVSYACHDTHEHSRSSPKSLQTILDLHKVEIRVTVQYGFFYYTFFCLYMLIWIWHKLLRDPSIALECFSYLKERGIFLPNCCPKRDHNHYFSSY